MPTLPVFNFSYWKPQPQTKLVEYSNYGGSHNTISSLDVESVGPTSAPCTASGENGSGNDWSPYNLCLDENYNLGHNSNTCNGDGGLNGAVWYQATSCNTDELYVEVSYYGSDNIGIAVTTDYQDMVDFIAGSGFLNYGNYSTGSGSASTSLYPDSVGQDIYIIVYEENNLGSSNTECSGFDVYAYQYACSSGGGITWEYVPSDCNLMITDNGGVSDQFQFKNDTSLLVSFYYTPTLQVDRTIEDDIGDTLECTNISIETIFYNGINQRLNYYATYSSITDITMDYDAGADAYYIYPEIGNEIYISDYFHTLLVVVSYTTNAGVIKKQQLISLISPDLYSNVFVSQYNGCSTTFYIPECTQTVNQIITFGTSINPTVVHFGTNHFSATYGSPISSGIEQNVIYTKTGSSSQTTRVLYPISNCTEIDCGNSTTNAGGQGVISYSVDFNNDVGMIRANWTHFGIADQIEVELPANVQIFNQHRLTAGSGEVFLEKTTTGSTSANRASVTITAPSVGTGWYNSFECVVGYTDVPSGSEFSTSSDKPKENFVRRIGPKSWEKAYENEHYTILSENITANSLTAISNEEMRLITDDDRFTTRLIPLTAYVDQYTQIPIVHYAVKFEHASDDTAYFTKIYMPSDDIPFLFNTAYTPRFGGSTYQWDPIVVPYSSTLPGEDYLIRSTGVMEYVKGNNTYVRPMSLIHKIDNVEIMDLFSTYDSLSFSSNGSPFAPSSTSFRPVIANNAISTMQPHISGSGSLMKYNYSSPFYQNDVDTKFVLAAFLDVKSSADVNTLNISSQAFNSVDGDDLQTATLTTGNTAITLTHYINSYNTEGFTITYSNKQTDRGFLRITVYDVLQPLLSTETYVYSTSGNTPTFAIVPTFNSTEGVDYSISFGVPSAGFNTVTSLSDDLVVCRRNDPLQYLQYDPYKIQ